MKKLERLQTLKESLRGGHEREVMITQWSEKRSIIVYNNLYSDRNNNLYQIINVDFIYRMEFYQRLIW